MRCVFLSSFGSISQLTEKDKENSDRIEQLYQQTLNQFYEALQKQANNSLTSKKLKENLLSFQKQIYLIFISQQITNTNQLENPRYDFKGLEFEIFNEDVIKNDFYSVAFEMSKAFYVDKLSLFFQSSNINDENLKILSLIYVLNSNIKNMKIYLGMNNSITNQSLFYILTALALNKNIQSIEIEYNNCDNLQLDQVTKLLSSFLHYKAHNGSLVEVSLSGGISLIKQPLIPQSLDSLQKIDLHVSNKILKNDDLLINICSGLQNNTHIEIFSLDFKNNKLTQRGITALANILNSQNQESKLKELRLSLSGVEEGSNASAGLPLLGEVLSSKKELQKLEINLNDFQMESKYFGEFLNFLKKKQGVPFNWFMISYIENPKVKIQDEIILGEIYSKNYLLYGLNMDITNNVIKISNKNMTNDDELTCNYEVIKNVGDSIYNFPNCQVLDLLQFRANWSTMLQRLLKYIHITAGCNTNSFITKIDDSNQLMWSKLDSQIFINKLQIFALYKHFEDVLPVSLPQIIYDLREDLDIWLARQFNIQ